MNASEYKFSMNFVFRLSENHSVSALVVKKEIVAAHFGDRQNQHCFDHGKYLRSEDCFFFL